VVRHTRYLWWCTQRHTHVKSATFKATGSFFCFAGHRNSKVFHSRPDVRSYIVPISFGKSTRSRIVPVCRHVFHSSETENIRVVHPPRFGLVICDSNRPVGVPLADTLPKSAAQTRVAAYHRVSSVLAHSWLCLLYENGSDTFNIAITGTREYLLRVLVKVSAQGA
jgi:hypothetical protein